MNGELIAAMRELTAALRGKGKGRLREMTGGTYREESRLFQGYSLTTARTEPGTELKLSGDYLLAATDGNLEGIGVRFNHSGADIQYFSERNPMEGAEFERFYLETPAQSGRTLYLTVGRDTRGRVDPGIAVIPKTFILSSDKDTHFTGALAQYAKEDESITGLLSDKIRITGLRIQADQNLDFWLMFWRTDGFDNTDLDLDTFAGAVQLDLSTWGLRPGGANQYYMSLEDVALDYSDDDETKELHISLYNASATAKNAGATGEFKVDGKYELRL